ncbi:hypothetical protein [Streptomyces sp. NPDC048442]|uniref:hypothetical protein n=1 Tax=Streptomyces sp. NPDC048442 TaxID=3154823 RepID=UPI00342B849C
MSPVTAPEGLIVLPGRGRTLVSPAQQVTFRVTGRHSRSASSCEVVVPPGRPHAFANPTRETARMFLRSAPPPLHERCFEELLEILDSGPEVDRKAADALRRRYDVEQLTPLKVDPPSVPDPRGDRTAPGTSRAGEQP